MADDAAPAETLTFTLNEVEAAAYARAVAAKQVRATGVGYSFIALVLAVPVIGLTVLAVRSSGLLPPRSGAFVLIAAVASYFLGFFVNHAEVRRARDRAGRQIHSAYGVTTEPRSVALAPDGVVWRTPGTRTHFDWSRVTDVTAEGPLALIWMGPAMVVPVPVRLFPTDAERDAFVTRVRDSAAAANPAA